MLVFSFFNFWFALLCFALLCSAVNSYDCKIACAFIAMHIHSFGVGMQTLYHSVSYVCSFVRSLVRSFISFCSTAHTVSFRDICSMSYIFFSTSAHGLPIKSWSSAIKHDFLLYVLVCVCACVCFGFAPQHDACLRIQQCISCACQRTPLKIHMLHFKCTLVLSLCFRKLQHVFITIAIVLWHTHHLRFRIASHLKKKSFKCVRISNSWIVSKRYGPHTLRRLRIYAYRGKRIRLHNYTNHIA